MTAVGNHPMPRGYRWRSSSGFVVACISVAVFSETFLYAFVVPILSYMIRERLHVDPSYIQHTTSAILAIHGCASLIVNPLIGYLSDRFLVSKKYPLLVALLGQIFGTTLLASARTMGILCLGRVVQSIAGAALWNLGYATIADHVDEENLARTMGIVDSVISAGTIAGPMASGLLFQAVGYWPTWAVPMGVLALDLIARLVMIDSPPEGYRHVHEEPPSVEHEFSAPSSSEHDQETILQANFYRVMLGNGRVLTAILTSMTVTSAMVSFDATLPLHVQESFGWGAAQTSLVFLSLQLPSIFISPLCGLVRDRVGTRVPTAVSLLAMAPCMLFLGVAGNEHLPSVSGKFSSGGVGFIINVLVIGMVIPFLGGIGVLELTAVVKELMNNNPYIFGPHGGYSRALSIAGLASDVAMMVGPILSGYLTETISYYNMNVLFALGFAILSIFFLGFGGSCKQVGMCI